MLSIPTRSRVCAAALVALLALGTAGSAQGTADPGIDSPGILPGEPVTLLPPVKRPPAKKAPAKKKASARPAPANASEAKGIYTVEKQGSGVYYRKGYVLGVGVNVIEADLSDPDVKVGAMVSKGGIGTAERFGQMCQRARPAAAITGTFFGVRNRIPTGDLVINGKSIFRGFIGTAVAITEGNLVSFIPTRYKDQNIDWSLFDTVIRGGPRLMASGQVVMTARSEGFRSLPVSARRTRTAIGLTRDNHLQFVAVRQGITLWELAKVMRALGAYHAVALDGGTSTAMYFAGRFIARPSRGLTNVLMIYHRRDSFESARAQFAKGAPPRPSVDRVQQELDRSLQTSPSQLPSSMPVPVETPAGASGSE